MPEFHIGQRVCFTPDAHVAERTGSEVVTVKGYECDMPPDGETDYVVVSVQRRGLRYEQWVLPDELVAWREPAIALAEASDFVGATDHNHHLIHPRSVGAGEEFT